MSSNELMSELIQMHIESFVMLGKVAELFSTHGEEAILICMYMDNKPFLAGDFKEKAGLTSGRIATILKQLESKGFIIRKQDESDKRKTIVELTDEGRKAIELKVNDTIEFHRKLLEYLGESDSTEFMRIMKRVLNYFSEHEQDFM